MDDSLKGKNVVIDISDGASSDDGHSDDDGYGDDDGHSDDDGYGVDDGLGDYRLDELTEEDVYEMVFYSDEDGERFYNAYAKVKGFSVRKDNIHKDNEGIVTSRKWVCSKEGYREAKYMEREDRKKEPMALTRVGCPAIFHLKLDRKSNKYVVANFVSFHNHNLIGPIGVPFLRSHKKVRSPDKASANTMHKVGIKTSHIIDFAAQQSGGYDKVGYTQKDLYNHFTAQRKIEIADGDAEGALAYLCAKVEYDPFFYYKYDVDEQNRLNNLFWRDSTSLTDYMCFGEMLVFDATYRTNAYGKPFVILDGVNSHFQTAIFGCALLTAETVEAYTWVLEKFLDSMGNEKMPVSVMTDGDKAMRRAIKIVLPNARHRLCKWHLKKNVVSNVHVPGFLCDFEKCMSMPTKEEFEIVWTNLVDDYNLHENNWAIKHAADTFSRAIFRKFWDEIKKEQSLFRVDKVEMEDFRVYYLSRYQQEDATWSVYYQPTEGIMKWSYLKFESIGFPCCHMISVMKMENLREIPSYLISQWWTKMAKSSSLHGRTPMPEWVTQTTRYGALSTACVEMAFYASHSTKAYDEAREEISRLTFKMKELYMLDVQSKQKATREENNVEGTSMHFGIGDPVIIKRKGSQNLAKDFIPKVRKCGHCRLPGHMRTKCPKLVPNNMGNVNENESDSSIVHPQSFTGRDSSTYYPQSFTGRDSSAYYLQSFTANGCESSVEPNLAAGWSTNPNSIQAQILGRNFRGWSTIPGNGSEG
ncbi:hypothetical protein RHMOL_Rhmol05G0120700 [Rhododendron molle]|uniref:Uncharacterized protein n=1 Tax=Rhododendron molle TaxID=49168 RepID=A0ACC0NNE2_RHOML|nr:hypothetical protein RHMOL_Rhmol05G0120700 [Rhododendron molle]